MPLNVTNVQVPLGAGVDTKTDPRLLPPGKVTSLVNGEFDKLGSLTKRKGHELVTTSSFFPATSSVGDFGEPPSRISGSIPTFQQLFPYQGALKAVDMYGSNLYSLSEQGSRWIGSDYTMRVPEATVTRRSVVQSTSDISNPDILAINGYIVLAWVGDTYSSRNGFPAALSTFSSLAVINVGNIYVSIIDEETGAVVMPQCLVSLGNGKATNPKLVKASSNQVVVTWVEKQGSPNYIYGCTLRVPTNGATDGAPYIQTARTQVSNPYVPYAMYCLDSCADEVSGTVYIAYATNTASGAVGLNSFDADTLTTITSGTFTASGSIIFAVGTCFAYSGTQGNLSVAVGHRANYGFGQPTYQQIWYNRFNKSGTSSLVANVPANLVYEQIAFTGSYSPMNVGMVPSGTRGDVYMVAQVSKCVQDGVDNIDILGNEPWPCAAKITVVGTSVDSNPDTGSTFAKFNPFVNVISKPFLVWDPQLQQSHVMVQGRSRYDVISTTGSIGTVQESPSALNTLFLFDTNVHDAMSSSNNMLWRPVDVASVRQANTILQTSALVSQNSQFFQNWGFLSNATTSSIYPRVWYTTGITVLSEESTGRGGIELLRHDFNPLRHFQAGELGDNVHLSAGVPSYFDGRTTGEINFLQYPNMGLKTTQFYVQTGVGGQIGQGTYQYQIVYEWIDAQGQRHQSAPSPAVSVNAYGAGFTNRVTITIPALTIQNRTMQWVTGSTMVAAAIYRSTVDGTVLYRLTPEATLGSLINDPIRGVMQYVDNLSDNQAGLSSRGTLYTQGGVLANFNPPSARLLCVHNNRLFLAGCDDPKVIWYSKQPVEGEGISFNDEFQFRVDAGGDITALASMDDKLIIFKADRIFFMVGTGPNELGQQNDFGDPTPIPSDVGCIEPRSVVLTPDGLMFRSNIGIHLLSRGLQVQNIGSPVQEYLNQYPDTTSAVIHPSKNQVRFTVGDFDTDPNGPSPPATSYLSNGVVLVHDYLAQAWSVFDLTDSRNDALHVLPSSQCVIGNDYYWASSYGAFASGTVGAVYKEHTSTGSLAWTDGGYYIPMTVETAWMATNDIQGFQRVRRVQVLAQSYDVCFMTVYLAHDYSPDYVQYVAFPVSGSTPVFQREMHVAQQKCEAIRIKIADSESADPVTTGRGLDLTRVTLRAGTKTGLQKLPPGSRA